MCREEPKFYFKETVGAVLDERGTINPQQNLDNIVSYQVVSCKRYC